MYEYNNDFYQWIIKYTHNDVDNIIPYLINEIRPKSIVDFGCGTGIWLKKAKEVCSEVTVLGLDGPYIKQEELLIDSSEFYPADLTEPIALDQHFDLAISTEVAEHIEERYAEIFLDNICRASDNVFFTAAIPGQGGVNHINEQWQTYWVNEFEKRGYEADLQMRQKFWKVEDMTAWRRQNILFFKKKRKSSKGNISMDSHQKNMIDVVHPEIFEDMRIKYENNVQLNEYLLMHPEITVRIDEAIEHVLSICKNIIIYPFGTNGYICKRLLNNKYGVSEFAIIDNHKCKTDRNICTVEDLSDIDKEFIILENSSNEKIHRELLTAIQRFDCENRVYSIFGV